MRRPRLTPSLDLDTVADALCDPTATAERQTEVRHFVTAHFGPLAEVLLRVGDQAAGAQRELATAREQLDRMIGGTQLRGIVTGVNNGHVRVQIGPTERILTRPPEMALGLGQTVFVDGTGQAVLGAGDYLLGGSTFAYCEALEGR